jgi:glycosyltransferase involved in cell wall biosynthesis
MSISIFIRTYKNDLEWLQYCLKSIHKYVTGYNKIVVCIPENQQHLLKDFNLHNVVTSPIYKDDYLGQQVSKLMADTYCNSEYVVYVDSDCVFTEPVDLSKRMFFNGKPIVYKTLYTKVGDAICWKEPTEKALNRIGVEWEYMRRMPIIYKSETIKDLRDYLELIHNRTLENHVIDRPFRQYSEFNVLGAYAESFCKEYYHFHDTDYGIEPNFLNQAWSWGGITNDIRKQLEEICK